MLAPIQAIPDRERCPVIQREDPQTEHLSQSANSATTAAMVVADVEFLKGISPANAIVADTNAFVRLLLTRRFLAAHEPTPNVNPDEQADRLVLYTFTSQLGGTSAVEPSPSETIEEKNSTEMTWLSTHTAELSIYAGEWLLIAGQGLIAHSRDFNQIKGAIRQHQIAAPFIYYVPLGTEANFVI